VYFGACGTRSASGIQSTSGRIWISLSTCKGIRRVSGLRLNPSCFSVFVVVYGMVEVVFLLFWVFDDTYDALESDCVFL